jgi:hypothetical protein
MANRYWRNKPVNGETIETTFHDTYNWGTSGTSGPGSPAPTTGDTAIFENTQQWMSAINISILEPILCSVQLIGNCGNVNFLLGSQWTLLNDYGSGGVGGKITLSDPSAVLTTNNYNMQIRSLYLNYGQVLLGTSTITFVYYEGVAP